MTQLRFSEAIPLSLYVHLPWCIKKCPYCDFNSHEQKEGGLPEARYVAALLKDLELSVPLIWGRRVSTIFIGGGTPSLFSAASIAELISGIRALINLSPSAEITLEANPGTFEADKFAGYREAGINRLSIGIQSLDQEKLAALGRVHNSDEAVAAFHIARSAGFDNINLDMMYALPGQTLPEAQKDLTALIELEPEHISYYQLTLEPNTYFHKFPPILPDHELGANISDAGIELLSKHGYERYEVSAFARAGKECQHNENYWQFGDYLGIGAGAHGKITQMALGEVTRTTKPRQPEQYLQHLQDGQLAAPTVVDRSELPFEYFLNSLRLTNGTPVTQFTERTGLDFSLVQNQITRLSERGLLQQIDDGLIGTTPTGARFLDELTSEFLKQESV